MRDWKKRLQRLNESETFNIIEEMEESMRVVGDKTCLTNETGSIVEISDNGDVIIKASPSTGIVLDSDNELVMISGKKLALMFEEIDIYTMPFQLRVNKFTLNTTPIPGAPVVLPDAPANIAKGVGKLAKMFAKIR